MKALTAEEFLVRDELFKTPLTEEEKHYYIDRIITYDDYIKAMIEFAKMHVQEALKQASEKAYAQGKGSTLTTKRSNFYYTYAGHIGKIEMNKESILNAYPLDLIE